MQLLSLSSFSLSLVPSPWGSLPKHGFTQIPTEAACSASSTRVVVNLFLLTPISVKEVFLKCKPGECNVVLPQGWDNCVTNCGRLPRTFSMLILRLLPLLEFWKSCFRVSGCKLRLRLVRGIPSLARRGIAVDMSK